MPGQRLHTTRVLASWVAALAWPGAAPPATAEVVARTAAGFELKWSRTVTADPGRSYAAATRRVGRWWSPDHTYSGVSRNLSLEPRAGGCFCERLAKRGSVQHLQVAYVVPGNTLRMLGGLGPLQELGASGVLTWHFAQVDGGGTRIDWTYRVTGLDGPAAAKLGAVVDQVLGTQLQRLSNYVDTGQP